MMRVWGFRLAFAAMLGLICSALPAQADDFSKKQRAEMRRFAANNSLFVLYHEVGHLLFHQLELPVLGREEDAADNVATWILLNKRSEQADRTLADAARGWIYSGVAYKSGDSESDYATGHSLDKQRAYQIVCLMVGMDEKAFRAIADEYRIDAARQGACNWDYSTVNRSLRGLLNRGANARTGTEVTVTYHDPNGAEAAADAFESSGVFDEVADYVRRNYSLSVPVAFNARSCGEANAFYDPKTVEVIFCYELMEEYMKLSRDNLEAASGIGSGKNKIQR
jgi:hypothetical protein